MNEKIEKEVSECISPGTNRQPFSEKIKPHIIKLVIVFIIFTFLVTSYNYVLHKYGMERVIIGFGVSAIIILSELVSAIHSINK